MHNAASDEQHRAIYMTDRDTWEAIEQRHKQILARTIGPQDSILDAGCGWGRLLTLLPPSWNGGYLGIDLSPDFIALARKRHRGRTFWCASLLNLPPVHGTYDWAVFISIRPMVIKNLGQQAWDIMEANLRQVAKKLLYLEYKLDDEGSVE
jgi:cyclopropane fatty-acyl-phospholipid synthase-like methyltransferase